MSSAHRVRAVCVTLLAVLALSGWSLAVRAARPPQATADHYYTRADFSRIEKIDAHVHVHGVADRFMEQAIRDSFSILTINTDYPDFPPIGEQQSAAVSLRRRYPGRVAFAATFSTEKFELARALYPFLDTFDVRIISGEIGLVKPDREIYDHLISKSGLNPSRSIFIDDSASNISSAAEAGLRTLHYASDAIDVRGHLKSLGVDLP